MCYRILLFSYEGYFYFAAGNPIFRHQFGIFLKDESSSEFLVEKLNRWTVITMISSNVRK